MQVLSTQTTDSLKRGAAYLPQESKTAGESLPAPVGEHTDSPPPNDYQAMANDSVAVKNLAQLQATANHSPQVQKAAQLQSMINRANHRPIPIIHQPDRSSLINADSTLQLVRVIENEQTEESFTSIEGLYHEVTGKYPDGPAYQLLIRTYGQLENDDIILIRNDTTHAAGFYTRGGTNQQAAAAVAATTLQLVASWDSFKLGCEQIQVRASQRDGDSSAAAAAGGDQQTASLTIVLGDDQFIFSNDRQSTEAAYSTLKDKLRELSPTSTVGGEMDAMMNGTGSSSQFFYFQSGRQPIAVGASDDKHDSSRNGMTLIYRIRANHIVVLAIGKHENNTSYTIHHAFHADYKPYEGKIIGFRG